MLTRRGIIGGFGALLAAPAVVKAASLMPVRGIIMPVFPSLSRFGQIWVEEYTKYIAYDIIPPTREIFCSYGASSSIR